MELGDFDNRKNHQIESSVPKVCLKEPVMVGIDEAGRGPVLGPMVYGAAYCPVSQLHSLKNMGFADSKTLTDVQREKLFSKFEEKSEMVGWVVNILSPNYISNSMLKKNKYNLNLLSHDSAIGIIVSLLKKNINISQVYLDTVGDEKSYKLKLENNFSKIKFFVSKKADQIFPIVSAASICAKVTRDKVVKEWKFLENISLKELDYGSGYPADPKTKNYLLKNLDPFFGFPQFVRFSWSTASNLLKEKAFPVFWEDDEEQNSKKKFSSFKQPPAKKFKSQNDSSSSSSSSITPAGTLSITNFFKSTNIKKNTKKADNINRNLNSFGNKNNNNQVLNLKCRIFDELNLKPVTEFK